MAEYIFKPDQLSKDFQDFFLRQGFKDNTPTNLISEAWNTFLHDEILPRKGTTEKFFSLYSILPEGGYEVFGSYGIHEHFDLNEQFINQHQLFKFIYPKQLPFFSALAQATVSFTIDDLKDRVGQHDDITHYQVTVPFKLKNGKYYSTVLLAQPFFLNEKGKAIAALNRYKVLSEYRGEPLRPIVYSNGILEDSERISRKFSLRARTFLKKIFEDQNMVFPFSPMLAKSLIYYTRNYGITTDEEAKDRNKSKRTCSDYRTQIIGKAKELTDKRFPDVFTVIDYFIEQGFLPGRNIFSPSLEERKED